MFGGTAAFAAAIGEAAKPPMSDWKPQNSALRAGGRRFQGLPNGDRIRLAPRVGQSSGWTRGRDARRN
jgi:hypothetical protein